MSIVELPKMEFHVHLRGAVSKEVLKELIFHKGVKAPFERFFSNNQRKVLCDVPGISALLRWESYWEKVGMQAETEKRLSLDNVLGEFFTFSSYFDFLKTYFFTGMYFHSKDAFRDLCRGICDYMTRDHIIYAEVFVSLREYVNLGVSLEDLVEVLFEEKERAKERGLYVEWILDPVRNYGGENAVDLVEKVSEIDSQVFSGITLGGNEKDYPPQDFIHLYRRAKDLGYMTSIHSGEGLGAESVAWVIDHIKPDRIGHGVRLTEDERLFEKYADQVQFEICPTSNLQLGLYSSVKDHPVGKFLEADAVFTLNTDDPSFFGVTLSQEFEKVQEATNQSDLFARLMKIAPQQMFCKDVSLKHELECRLKAAR